MFTSNLSVHTQILARFASVFLVLTLLAGFLPQPALAFSPPAAQTCNTRYTVKSGDTLSSIALQYKIDWTVLAAANNLREPYTIYVGQVLCIPVTTTSTSTGTSASSNRASFSLALKGRFLVITTSNFPKKNLYYVKVSEGRFRQGPGISIVGRLMVRNKPDNVYSYKLPRELTTVRYLMVCLKNVVTDVNTCRSLFIER
ncbi:MAG TPA: LysM peptidoglycan-binding domain-containing protein [Anaerolineales bacterium]|nr:LysM peptidoglycan-binding domain-containing protein [Anaerolineales bacterium]